MEGEFTFLPFSLFGNLDESIIKIKTKHFITLSVYIGQADMIQ